MASAPQHLLSRDDLRKPPSTSWRATRRRRTGSFRVNPYFLYALQQAVIEKANETRIRGQRLRGPLRPAGVRKVRERNRLTLRGRMRAADLPMLQWATSLPAGAGTSEESRTFVDSYLDSAGTETYRVWRGCRPLSCTVTISPTEPVMLEVEMAAQQFSKPVRRPTHSRSATDTYTTTIRPEPPCCSRTSGRSFTIPPTSHSGAGRSHARSRTVSRIRRGPEYDIYREVSQRA